MSPVTIAGRSLGVAQNGVFSAANTDPIAGGRLWPEAAATWSAMRAAFVAAGGNPAHFVPGGPNSSARSIAAQQHFWAGQPPPAARPGTCLEAGAAVLTLDGLLPIEQVQVGDAVMTHRGRWRVVTDTRRFADREVVKVACSGHPGVYATPEHRWFAFAGWTIPKGIAHAGQEMRVVRSAEVHGDLLASPYEFPAVPLPDEYEMTIEFLSLCGRYVADGSFHDRGGPGDEGILYARTAKAPAVMELARASGVALTTWAGREGEGVVRLRLNGELARWLVSHFGSLSTRRTIPAWLLSAPAELRRSFLDGYLAGDGCWVTPRNKTAHWAWSTSSRCLAVGIVMLAQSLGLHAGLTNRAWAKESVVKGRRCRPTAETWRMAVYPDLPPSGVRRWPHEGFIVSRARVSAAEPREVYDLTVDEDESFIADGLVSHNSNHGWGIAVDIPFRDAQAWLMRNAHRYGWSWDEGRRVGEPWHWRYTGASRTTLRKLRRDPLAGFTRSERRWIAEYDRLKKANRDRARRRVLRRVMAEQAARIRSVAAQDRKGMTRLRRRRILALERRSS